MCPPPCEMSPLYPLPTSWPFLNCRSIKASHSLAQVMITKYLLHFSSNKEALVPWMTFLVPQHSRRSRKTLVNPAGPWIAVVCWSFQRQTIPLSCRLINGNRSFFRGMANTLNDRISHCIEPGPGSLRCTYLLFVSSAQTLLYNGIITRLRFF